MQLRTLTAAALAAVASSRAPAGIYGIDSGVGLMRIFANNGSAVPLSPDIPYEQESQQLSALDATRGIFYVLGYAAKKAVPDLIGFSLTNGTIVSNVPVPFVEQGIVGSGQYLAVEPATGRLIAGGQVKAAGKYTYGFVDPSTGNYTEVASVPASLVSILGDAATYDSVRNTLLCQWSDTDANAYTYEIDMGTGKVTRQLVDFNIYMETLDFDETSGRIYGLGSLPNASSQFGITRALMVMDATTYNVSVVAPVYDFTDLDGSITALDTDNRVLYCIGQKTGATSADPFFLIGLSLVDGSVASAVELCANIDVPQCPWDLQYFPIASSPA